MGNNIYLGFSEKQFSSIKCTFNSYRKQFPSKIFEKNFDIKGNIDSNIKYHKHKTNLLKLWLSFFCLSLAKALASDSVGKIHAVHVNEVIRNWKCSRHTIM